MLYFNCKSLHPKGILRTMRTQLMPERAAGMPWLERDTGGGLPDRTPLPSFPFTMGRGEVADLVVDSGRVSREHAMILCEAGQYRLRDLASTNGTFLNGQRIDEAPLHDGDILVLADVELTFFAGPGPSPQEMATQVMGLRRADSGGRESATQLIGQLRRLYEMLTHRAFEIAYAPVVRLEDGEVLGYEAVGEPSGLGPEPTSAERLLSGTECRLWGRLSHLRRTVAAEEAAAFPPGAAVFLKLGASEIGGAGLADSLGRLRRHLAAGRRLIVEVPDAAVSDTPYYRELRRKLESLEVGIAHGDFAAGAAQLVQQEPIRPDFLKLARPLVRSLDRSQQRQHHLQSVVEAAERIGCQVVAVGVRTEAEEDVCRQLRCGFAQGERFGEPLPAALLAQTIHA
jgi:EAL domain-containing protein (putative c-di-GMP-specific phosphodiesterase class I)